jgi:hypothetical protein
MKTINTQDLASVCGGAGISIGEASAWRSGMAQSGPRTLGSHGRLPAQVPANTSLGEMSAWRSGMGQGGPGKK